ncbi:MAG: family 43 glycosylhydrolase [Tepidisphaeraceae bacterium]
MRLRQGMFRMIWGGLAFASVARADPAMSGNPLFPGADPDVAVVGDALWIYPTFSPDRDEAFYAFSSTTLANWQRHGPILRLADVPWVKADGRQHHGAWAPTIFSRDGRYYFYYAVGPQSEKPSRIGVGVSDSPAGPFVDSGKPLLSGARNQFEAIDPMVFADPKDGRVYLYAGGSNGAKLRVFELNRDLVSIAREVPVETPKNFTEGAFMHERRGVYYLSYSHGSYRDTTYSVHYATAPTPTGPWTYRGAILTSDATHKGPGHHAFFKNPASGEWYIVYHRWEHQTGDGPYHGSRQVCIDRMTYDDAGLIRPIVMTDTGVPLTSFGRK